MEVWHGRRRLWDAIITAATAPQLCTKTGMALGAKIWTFLFKFIIWNEMLLISLMVCASQN